MDDRYIVGLDIGSSKIKVAIASVSEDNNVSIIAHSQEESDGIRCGNIIHIEKAVRSIRNAIEKVEGIAGVDVQEVVVNISGRHIEGMLGSGQTALRGNGHPINRDDIDQVLKQAKAIPNNADRKLLEVIPQSYSIDGEESIPDPTGMSGVKLEGRVHLISAASNTYNNLLNCLNQAELNVSRILFSGLASAESVLSDEEKKMGVALFDIGSGTIDIVAYKDDSVVYSGCIDLGSAKITQDLSYGLHTTPKAAEHIKRSHGACYLEESENCEIEVSDAGGRETRFTTRDVVVNIIQSRMTEILEITRKELDNEDVFEQLKAGIIITGGGANLAYLSELTADIFNDGLDHASEIRVGIGFPKPMDGVDTNQDASLSTVLGLIKLVVSTQGENNNPTKKENNSSFGTIKSLFKTLKDYI